MFPVILLGYELYMGQTSREVKREVEYGDKKIFYLNFMLIIDEQEVWLERRCRSARKNISLGIEINMFEFECFAVSSYRVVIFFCGKWLSRIQNKVLFVGTKNWNLQFSSNETQILNKLNVRRWWYFSFAITNHNEKPSEKSFKLFIKFKASSFIVEPRVACLLRTLVTLGLIITRLYEWEIRKIH